MRTTTGKQVTAGAGAYRSAATKQMRKLDEMIVQLRKELAHARRTQLMVQEQAAKVLDAKYCQHSDLVDLPHAVLQLLAPPFEEPELLEPGSCFWQAIDISKGDRPPYDYGRLPETTARLVAVAEHVAANERAWPQDSPGQRWSARARRLA